MVAIPNLLHRLIIKFCHAVVYAMIAAKFTRTITHIVKLISFHQVPGIVAGWIVAGVQCKRSRPTTVCNEERYAMNFRVLAPWRSHHAIAMLVRCMSPDKALIAIPFSYLLEGPLVQVATKNAAAFIFGMLRAHRLSSNDNGVGGSLVQSVSRLPILAEAL